MGTEPPPPQCISLEAHRDDRHVVERAFRWGTVVILLVLVGAGLANVFGQRHVVRVASSPAATLRVSAPGALRSGLLYQGKFEVDAHRTLSKPTLVLAGGWWDAMSVNSIEPNPTRSWSDGGRIGLEFDAVAPGHTLTVYLYQQANPTTVGRRDLTVELRDGKRTIGTVRRSIHVFP